MPSPNEFDGLSPEEIELLLAQQRQQQASQPPPDTGTASIDGNILDGVDLVGDAAGAVGEVAGAVGEVAGAAADGVGEVAGAAGEILGAAADGLSGCSCIIALAVLGLVATAGFAAAVELLR